MERTAESEKPRLENDMHNYEKVFFPIHTNEVKDIVGEWLWTMKNENGNHIIENSPFFIFNVSYKDVISVRLIDDRITFDKVISRSGHSTYRVRLPLTSSHSEFLKIWSKFSELGCSYEGSTEKRLVYAIDCPPNTNVHRVYTLLEEYEKKGIFEFEEAHYCD